MAVVLMLNVRYGLPRLFSAAILGAIAWFGWALAPYSSGLGLTSLSLSSLPALTLDPNAYLLSEGRYSRIGRVRQVEGETRLRLVPFSEPCDCVAVLVRPNLVQFFAMLSPEERDNIAEAFVETVAEATQTAILGTQASDQVAALREMFTRALAASLGNPEFRNSEEEFAAVIRSEIGGDVTAELQSILTSRILEAAGVVLRDATEHYGLDLLRGRFSTAPLSDAVDSLIFDPRVIALFGDVIVGLAEDEKVVAAVRSLLAEYSASLFDAFVHSESDALSIVLADTVAGFRSVVEYSYGLVYRDGATHPVILGLLRGELLPRTERADAILIIMDREDAMAGFPDGAIHVLLGASA